MIDEILAAFAIGALCGAAAMYALMSAAWFIVEEWRKGDRS